MSSSPIKSEYAAADEEVFCAAAVGSMDPPDDDFVSACGDCERCESAECVLTSDHALLSRATSNCSDPQCQLCQSESLTGAIDNWINELAGPPPANLPVSAEPPNNRHLASGIAEEPARGMTLSHAAPENIALPATPTSAHSSAHQDSSVGTPLLLDLSRIRASDISDVPTDILKGWLSNERTLSSPLSEVITLLELELFLRFDPEGEDQAPQNNADDDTSESVGELDEDEEVFQRLFQEALAGRAKELSAWSDDSSDEEDGTLETDEDDDFVYV